MKGRIAMKKNYVKPEFKMVGLRTEERLAACSGYYTSTFAEPGCNDNQFQNITGLECYVVTSEQAGS